MNIKKNPCNLVLLIILWAFSSSAQPYSPLFLNGQTLEMPENKGKLSIRCFDLKKETFAHIIHVYLQFYQLPGESEKKNMEAKGIRFLSNYPNNTYLCAIPSKQLKFKNNNNIRCIRLIPSEAKIGSGIKKIQADSNTSKNSDSLVLLVSYYEDLNHEDVKAALLKQKYLLRSESKALHHFFIRMKETDIKKFASWPFISSLDTKKKPAIPEN